MSGQLFHEPVLAEDVVRILTVRKNAVIFDGTLGGGGHAEKLLKELGNKALYIGADRDAEAIEFSRKRLSAYGNVLFYKGLFSEIKNALKVAKVDYVDGILLDLGVSSHQIDEDKRGFAYRSGLTLDMRMNREDGNTAADVLNTFSENELYRVFKDYGEERFSRKIARGVVKEREKKPFCLSDDLMRVIASNVAGKYLVKSYARIFQALRIEVNNELAVLRNALAEGVDCLTGGGRLAVITYHSLEDRIVKQFIRKQENPCACPSDLPYCVCGKKPRMRRLRPEVILPGEEEIRNNIRARSAKLRAGEKV